MIDTIEERACTGCKLCGDLCPKDAITFESDKYGFWYPRVNERMCTSCGACVTCCPGLHPFTSETCKEPNVYSAWLKDTDMRLFSTSGGVYYALADNMLKKGGLVAACKFTDDWKHAEHVMADSEELLTATVRSKYFQSDTAGIYRKVRDALKGGKKVLFCGTPCQCAAVQRFAGRDKNLLTMDFICRGNNSQKAYEAFICELERRYGSPVKRVEFKNKRKGWTSLGFLAEFENGEEYFDTRDQSYWTLGYIKDNLYMRPSCHECQYRKIPRISDFTVGDFWGIKNCNEEDLFRGISALFVNSEAAAEFLEEVRESLVLEPHTLTEAIKGNPCILNSPAEGIHRERFFSLLEHMDFTEAVAECCGKLEL